MNTLKKGDNGNEVLQLQQLLINAGIVLSADGDFGNTTAAKVKEFQSKNGLALSLIHI